MSNAQISVQFFFQKNVFLFFQNNFLKWPKIAFKFYTKVGYFFEFSNGLKWHLSYPPWLDRILLISNGLKLYLNYPLWMEKMLNFTYLKWPKIGFKLATIVGEYFEFYLSHIA